MDDITFDKIYLPILVVALLSSCLSHKKGSKGLWAMILVLAATLMVESCSLYLIIHKKQGYLFRFHIFNLVEYSMFAVYYLNVCKNNKYKQWVRISIPVYILTGIILSIINKFAGFPTTHIKIEGVLMVILYTHLLFNLEVNIKTFIYTHPDFWIAAGVLVYFGGAFVALGLYTLVAYSDKRMAGEMFRNITQPLNLFFYICIIIASICSILNKKYLTQ